MYSFLRRVGSALLVALLLGTFGRPALAQFGVAAGANFQALDDIAAGSRTETVDNATGYHLGVVYDVSVGPVALRPGVFYRDIGSYDFSDVQGSDLTQVDVTAFEALLDLRVSLLPTPLVRPYLVGGPSVFVPQSEDDALEDGLESASYAFNLGVGVGISVPGVDLTLQPELRYEIGATDYLSDFQVGDTPFSPSEQKLSAFALRLHVLF
jgi:hypothetical protein